MAIKDTHKLVDTKHPKRRLTAARIIAQRLHAAGSRYAFGIPGGEVLNLMEALDQAGIRVILVKHENCAGFMGEGVWHHDAAPAILFATIGPGVANAVNAIVNAWQDRVPMIVLTGCVSALDQHTYTHQVFEHVKLLEPVTKASFRVDHGTAAVLVDKAIAIATSGRPGPVVLDVPIDVQQTPSNEWHFSTHCVELPSAPTGVGLQQARAALDKAQRPLVIAGLDAVNQQAAYAVDHFCHHFGALLITTYKAKGLIPEDDLLALGGAGLSPLCDTELLPLVQSADCVVLAGYDPIEMRVGWRDPFVAGQTVIELSAVSNTHYMHQASHNFVCDIGESLRVLSEGLAPRLGWPESAPQQVRARLTEKLRANEPWGPAAVIDEVRAACPRETVATVDAGAHRILLSQLWQCFAPRTLLQSTALCTMGCAVPLAIGRKLAEPDRPVIAFVGDAGLEMFLGELATARDLELSLPIVVFVDEQLGLIELKQRGLGMDNLAVNFPGTNFSKVATALGGYAQECDSRGSLKQAIKAAFARDRFSLISVMIGSNAYDGRI